MFMVECLFNELLPYHGLSNQINTRAIYRCLDIAKQWVSFSIQDIGFLDIQEVIRDSSGFCVGEKFIIVMDWDETFRYTFWVLVSGV